MSNKSDRRRAKRVLLDPSVKTPKQINQERETRTQPYGQHSVDEKRRYIDRCAFDVLAAASMAEQVANGDEAVVPTGIDLPADYLANPDAAASAYETLNKPSPRNQVLMGCIQCCNTVGLGIEVVSGEDTARVIGQQTCQKYCHSEPIQF
jgi:hypothetical protein